MHDSELLIGGFFESRSKYQGKMVGKTSSLDFDSRKQKVVKTCNTIQKIRVNKTRSRKVTFRRNPDMPSHSNNSINNSSNISNNISSNSNKVTASSLVTISNISRDLRPRPTMKSE